MWIGCSRLSKKGIKWGFNGVHDIWVWLEGGHKIAVKPWNIWHMGNMDGAQKIAGLPSFQIIPAGTTGLKMIEGDFGSEIVGTDGMLMPYLVKKIPSKSWYLRGQISSDFIRFPDVGTVGVHLMGWCVSRGMGFDDVQWYYVEDVERHVTSWSRMKLTVQAKSRQVASKHFVDTGWSS